MKPSDEKIPRIIHYCWLSGEKKPEIIRNCIRSWREKLPDFEIRCWDMNSLDTDSVRFVREAIRVRKWAFAADYIRLYALYHHGGIYLDSDVELRWPLYHFLHHRVFTGIEGSVHPDGARLVAAHLVGSEKGHPWIKECLDYYKDRPFILSGDASLPPEKRFDMTILPRIMANQCLKYGYDPFIKYDLPQDLDEGIYIYPSVYFDPQYAGAHAVHHCLGSWRSDASSGKGLRQKIKRLFGK